MRHWAIEKIHFRNKQKKTGNSWRGLRSGRDSLPSKGLELFDYDNISRVLAPGREEAVKRAKSYFYHYLPPYSNRGVTK